MSVSKKTTLFVSRKVWLAGLGVLILIASSWFAYQHKQILSMPHVTIGNTMVFVEEAKTAEEQAKGLGERDSLPSDKGMIFRFSPSQKPTFWMKGMRFPLDFLWVKDGAIIDLTEHIAAPLTTPQTALPTYQPSSNVDTVIEVNAGFVEHYKIKVGDRVSGL